MSSVVTDYELVVAEIKRRGLWDQMNQSRLPNRTLANPHRNELFYIQDQPRLAAWAIYDTADEWREAFANMTHRRIISQTE